MRRLFSRLLQNAIVLTAIRAPPQKRPSKDEDIKKRELADLERRNLYGPWMSRYAKSNRRPIDHQFSAHLSELLSARPLGARYREDLVEVRPVLAKDNMPVGMVGQLGVVARLPIPKDTLIGIYEGRILNAYEVYAYRDNMDYFMDASVPSVSPEDVIFEFDPLDPCLYRRGDEHDFTIDPSPPYGNGVLERINDYRLDVSKPEDERVNPWSRCNVYAQQLISTTGEPWTCILSSKDIDINQPLLLDYGPNYWRAKLRRLSKTAIPPIVTDI